VCDLGFFRTLQSEQWKLLCAKTVDELIARVTQAFNELDPKSIGCNFLTFQSCLDEIVVHHGANGYKIPHLAKNKLRAHGQGKLPDSLPVSDIAKEAMEELGVLRCLTNPI
jgi:hypothetical protein